MFLWLEYPRSPVKREVGKTLVFASESDCSCRGRRGGERRRERVGDVISRVCGLEHNARKNGFGYYVAVVVVYVEKTYAARKERGTWASECCMLRNETSD